jgi:hypothetical protein
MEPAVGRDTSRTAVTRGLFRLSQVGYRQDLAYMYSFASDDDLDDLSSESRCVLHTLCHL